MGKRKNNGFIFIAGDSKKGGVGDDRRRGRDRRQGGDMDISACFAAAFVAGEALEDNATQIPADPHPSVNPSAPVSVAAAAAADEAPAPSADIASAFASTKGGPSGRIPAPSRFRSIQFFHFLFSYFRDVSCPIPFSWLAASQEFLGLLRNLAF